MQSINVSTLTATLWQRQSIRSLEQTFRHSARRELAGKSRTWMERCRVHRKRERKRREVERDGRRGGWRRRRGEASSDRAIIVNWIIIIIMNLFMRCQLLCCVCMCVRILSQTHCLPHVLWQRPGSNLAKLTFPVARRIYSTMHKYVLHTMATAAATTTSINSSHILKHSSLYNI